MADGCLPDVSYYLTAEVLAESLAARHDTLRGGDNGDAEAAEYQRNVLALLVDAQAGLAHALEAGEHGPLVGAILEPYAEHSSTHVGGNIVITDEALVLENSGDLHLDAGCGYHHALVPSHARVADACQHIGDRVCHVHKPSFLLAATAIWPS